MVASVLYLIQKSIVNHFRKFILHEYIYEYTYVVNSSVNFLSEKISKQQKSEKLGQNQQKIVDFVVIIIYIYYYKNFPNFEKLPIYYR